MSQIFKPEASTPPPPGFVEFLEGQDSVPVGPNASDIIFVKGAVVAAGSTPFTTTGNAGTNTETWSIQLTQAIASSNATNVGLAAFNSAQFTVDANGFVSLRGTGVGETITGNTGGALSPTAGNWNIFGAAVAAGTTPLATAGSGSTLTVNVQRSQAIASTNATNVGLAAFNSAQFTVDGNGFVSTSGTGVGNTITGQSGGALSPTAGNWNIYANGVSASGTSTAGNMITSGSGNTLTVNSTEAQFMTNYTQVLIGASPYTVLATDYYISCVSSGGAITIKLPNAPTTNRLIIVKDLSGNASASNISVTTVGGSVTIDGQTTYTIASNYAAISLLFNGSTWEVF